MVMDMILQSMKYYKLVFINTGVGLFINAALDIPIIYWLNKINFYPYIGSLIASIIGQTVSIMIIMVVMKKKYKYNFKPIVLNALKVAFATLIIGVILFVFKSTIMISERALIKIMQLGVVCSISLIIYIFVTYKTGAFKESLGEGFMEGFFNKFKKKGNE